MRGKNNIYLNIMVVDPIGKASMTVFGVLVLHGERVKRVGQEGFDVAHHCVEKLKSGRSRTWRSLDQE